jgi:DNA-binding CsgD family transcriptional regulator
MPDLDKSELDRVAEELMAGRALTPSERAEVLRIAQGFACKDSASATSTSPETIRARRTRRKRIYRKLGVSGAAETLSSLLALSLQRLDARTGGRRDSRHGAPLETGGATIH